MLEIGKAIRMVRQASGIGLNDLAKASEVSAPFLCLVEKGHRQPSLAVIRKIANALGVPSESLIVLAQPTQGTLRTADDFAEGIVSAIRSLAEAEDRLRTRLSAGAKRMDPRSVKPIDIAVALRMTELSLGNQVRLVEQGYKPTRKTWVKGKLRDIDAPRPAMKAFLRRLHRYLTRNFPFHPCVHGGVRDVPASRQQGFTVGAST